MTRRPLFSAVALHPAAIAILLTLTPLPVQAQVSPDSPEAAVAYLLFGIEDGANGKLDGERSWRRVHTSPAYFRAGKLALKVVREGDCVFRVIKTESDGDFAATLDLKRISAWRAEGNDSVVEGDGLCLGYAGQCPAKRFAFQVPRIDAGKLDWNQTHTWLRANVCKS